ncbi:MAG: Crp/Fnr family transcriptional regulator [Bauldia sp.]
MDEGKHVSPVKLLEKCFLFQALDEPAREELAVHAARHSFRSGETVCNLGDPGDSMMVIVTGSVRVYLPAPKGKEIVLATLAAGEVLGEISVLDGGERSAAVAALTNCDLLYLHRRDILPVLTKRPEACLKLLEVLCGRVRRSNETVSDMMFFDLPTRLAKALIRQTGAPGGASYSAKVSASQSELARLIGGTRESVNRALRDWQRRRVLDLKDGWIIILDHDALAVLAGREAE